MRLQSVAFAMSLALGPAFYAGAGEPSLPPLYSPKPSAEMSLAELSHQGRFAVRPALNFNSQVAEAQADAGTTVALWSRTVSVSGVSYTYTMVGKNPFVVQSAPAHTTPAVVIPLHLIFTSFGNYVADPAVADPTCSPKGTALALTKASPLFNAISGTVWNTSVGTGEYVDLFQRANYDAETNQNTGINPGYHNTIASRSSPGITINVSGGDVVPGTCGQIGMLDFTTWDNYVQTQLMPFLAAQSPPIAPPTSLAILLLYNVVLYDGSTSNCCILGYHSAFNDPSYGGAFHTYISVEFDTNQSFTGVADVSAMSHEVAEWMDDPPGNNPTPPWGNIGQVSGCQANLEVGDPLSGTLSQIYMPSNKYTYHVQDLAFTSWFYDQARSTGVNGWYSLLGNFLTPAVPCG